MTPEEEGRLHEGSGPDNRAKVDTSILPAADPRRPPRNQPARPSRRSNPSDSPAVVAELVAKILDGGPTSEERDLPRALQEITRIRSAARRIREAQLEPEDEDRLLGGLARRAARAELREWALDAIIVEIRGPDIEVTSPNRTAAHVRLRRAGFAACPTCQGRVITDAELEDRQRREKWAAQDLARWERVVR